MEKHLSDLRSIALLGSFKRDEDNDLIQFTGGEYNPKLSADAIPTLEPETVKVLKFVNYGILIFDQQFSDGRLKMQVTFDNVDYRSSANIIIRHTTSTGEMLTFGIGGGGLYPTQGTGPFFGLRGYVTGAGGLREDQQNAVPKSEQKKTWINYIQGGDGRNLEANREYEIEVLVKGTLIVASVDGVEVARYTLPSQSVIGRQVGVSCGNYGDIKFGKIVVEPSSPRAFVVMQFNTPEYEALFTDVIEPVCRTEGLDPFRADFTYLPGLVVADIQKQIAESRVIIAEITPSNPNVYYEVGYADALGKPLILVADKKEGLKPFDVRAYRTIFYENSIGGKNKVEGDLRSYLRSIMSS